MRIAAKAWRGSSGFRARFLRTLPDELPIRLGLTALRKVRIRRIVQPREGADRVGMLGALFDLTLWISLGQRGIAACTKDYGCANRDREQLLLAQSPTSSHLP